MEEEFVTSHPPRIIGTRISTLPNSSFYPPSNQTQVTTNTNLSVFHPRRESLTKHLSHRDDDNTKWHVHLSPSVQRVMSHDRGQHRLSLRDIRPMGVTGDDEGTDKVRDRLVSLWNNVKYGWNVRLQSSFNSESAIWMLGTLYHHNLVDCDNKNHHIRNGRNSRRPDEASVQRRKEAAIANFKQDYFSRIWFTYRKNFPRIDGTQLTTDCGWGCMIRTGQMIMAQALITNYLGRDWRWTGSQSDKTDMIHRMIIKWFLDDPDAPFSLHRLVKIGECLGKKPGDWYGPATVAYMLTQALTEGFVENPILENVVSYVAQDCTVYIQDVIKLCTQSTSNRRRVSLVKRDARNRASMSLSFNRDSLDLHQLSLNEADFTFVHVHGDESFDAEDDDEEVLGNEIFEPRIAQSNSGVFTHRASSTFNLFTDSSTSHPHSSINGMHHLRKNHINPTSTMTSGYASMASTSADPSTSTTSAGDGVSSEGVDHEGEQNEKWRGVIIFIPVRLGGEKFNPVYTECIKSVFSHQSTLGIIGGRPRHSLYFVGVQEDKLIYLDPHLCQDAVEDTVNFPLESFHCNCARKMSISKMDPSCTIAFLCRTRQEFFDLISSVKDFMVPGARHTDYPIFVFAEGTSAAAKVASPIRNDSFSVSSISSPLRNPRDAILRAQHDYSDPRGRRRTQSDLMSDDFVLIS